MRDAMTVWIVAGVLLAIALLYGLLGNQITLFWTIVVCLIVLAGVVGIMYVLNKEADKGTPP